MAMQGTRRYDNIGKSKHDDRQYRGLLLSNKMKVLLISDPSADKAAAALDVNVGSMSNPVELPGLAHFCEHMLFLGTERYPNEDEYHKFINQHGGSCNAYTSSEHTNYYFDVSHEHLKGALDRFSQFFISPLFDSNCTDREMNAVNSEHEKNIMSDAWRLQRLDKVTSDPKHKYNMFGTGNKETLDTTPKERGLDVRSELLKFHEKFYSSNVMGLSVLGRESLDELTEYVSTLFSDVVNKEVEVPFYEHSPYREQDMVKKCIIVPVKDIRNLGLTFPIPDLNEYYDSNKFSYVHQLVGMTSATRGTASPTPQNTRKPGSYLGHLIGHEGPGSLLSLLKELGWVNSLVAGQKGGARGFDFFIIQVDLTQEGIGHVEDIIECMFQYIAMLRNAGWQEWVYNEIKEVNAIDFKFKDKEKPSSYVSKISQALHYFPIEQILTAGSLLKESRPDIVQTILDKLRPRNMKVSVVGKAYESKANLVEKYYGARYAVEPIAEEKLAQWENVKLNKKLHLHSPNEFIPSQLGLKAVPADCFKVPKLLKDDQFKMPKAVVSFDFFSPYAYVDPLHCNMVHLFADLFMDALNEYSYAAEIAGLGFKFHNTVYGISLRVSGYEDKQSVLLNKILTKMTSFHIDPQRFAILKELYMRSLENFIAEQPYKHSAYYYQILHTDTAWTKKDLLDVLSELTLERLQDFIPKFLSYLHIEALLHGNITEEDARSLMTTVEESFKNNCGTHTLLPSQLVRHRDVQLPLGSSYVHKHVHRVCDISAVQVYFQVGLHNTRENVLLELMAQMISEPFFNILRTKEQLGYIVHCGTTRSNGTQGLRFIVQSDRSPNYLEARVEAFVQHVENLINDMDDAEFARHKAALKALRLEKPKKLKAQSMKYWGEILSQQYMFDRDEVEMAYLDKILKDDVAQFHRKFLSLGASTRAKLSVYIVGKHISECPTVIDSAEHNSLLPEDFLKCPPIPEATVINDAAKFKQSLSLYPRVQPYIDFDQARL